MAYKILGLDPQPVETMVGGSEEAIAAQGALRVTATDKDGGRYVPPIQAHNAPGCFATQIVRS